MAGWGTGLWGTSTWGLAGATSLSIISAYAVTERSLQVVLTSEAKHKSSVGVGDALNPATWRVVRNDTGASLLVLAVRNVSAGTVYELFLLDKLGNYMVTHTVSSTSLTTPLGSLIGTPNTANFLGCAKAQTKLVSASIVDLKNVPTGPTELSGTIEVGSDGDYQVHSGIDMLKKFIIRRLVTMPGEFFFLSPQYGIGFRIKEPLPTADLVKLRTAIELQLQQEPEFARVAVQLSLSSNNILSINVKALLSTTQQEVAIPIAAPAELVQL